MLWNARMRRGSDFRTSGRRDRAATLYPHARPNRRAHRQTVPAAPSRPDARDGGGTRLDCRSRRANALRARCNRCDRSSGAERLHPTDHNFCKNGRHDALSTQDAPSIRQIVLSDGWDRFTARPGCEHHDQLGWVIARLLRVGCRPRLADRNAPDISCRVLLHPDASPAHDAYREAMNARVLAIVGGRLAFMNRRSLETHKKRPAHLSGRPRCQDAF